MTTCWSMVVMVLVVVDGSLVDGSLEKRRPVVEAWPPEEASREVLPSPEGPPHALPDIPFTKFSNDTLKILSQDKERGSLPDEHLPYTNGSSLSRSLIRRCCRRQSVEEPLESLKEVLTRLVMQEMNQCDLVVTYDLHYSFLQDVVTLANVKQVWQVRGGEDLVQVLWSSSRCSGYLMLLLHSQHLLHDFTNTHLDAWDYYGRYVVVAGSVDDLDQLMSSAKIKNTEQLVGLVQTKVAGEWGVYVGEASIVRGLQLLSTWKEGVFIPNIQRFYLPPLTSLHGTVLKVVTFKWEPNVFYLPGKEGKIVSPYGVDIDVVTSLAHFYNFSVLFLEPPPGELWGEDVGGGHWSGMLGQLQRGEAHLGVASIYVSADRASAVDFTTPYDSRMSCFMARREQPLPRWYALTYPFSAHVWFTVMAGFLLAGLLLCLVARTSGYRNGEILHLQQVGYCYMYTFGLHIQRALPSLPRSSPTRILLGALWLYALILTLAYCTNLTAYLIVAKTPASMDTVRQLKASGVDVAGLGYFYKNALSSSTDPDLRSLAKNYEPHQSVESIFPRVLQGRSVFLQNRAFIEFISLARFTRRGVTSMRIMKECFAPYSVAAAVQRHSPLKTRFDRVIGWLQHSGLVRQFFLNSLRLAASTQEYRQTKEGIKTAVADTPGEGHGEATPLTIDHLQGIFFIVALGWFSSLLVFSLELKLSYRA
ncbi:glutamate receptor ionotropic, delta-1 isoform X3 [Cherax quadricarinatus]|nr:glutamate receptor ionotropic, delta-1-like isoform X2 [Cherax quadricarinatus]XP_053630215.1 glutamate receptor ionotropic, delta-1-like isoform X2 [Cherax quadricarinatus]